jgi:hypothetical protein
VLPDDDVRLFPAWKHALAALLERGLDNGLVITKAELCELFGLREPTTIDEYERHQFAFMRQFDELRSELLEEHRIALRTLYGEASYEVVPPHQQTDLAMTDGMRELQRTLRKMARTVAFVRQEELTDAQRKANADAQAKVAMLASMARRPRLSQK